MPSELDAYLPIIFVAGGALLVIVVSRLASAWAERNRERLRTLASSLGLSLLEGLEAVKAAAKGGGEGAAKMGEWLARNPEGLLARSLAKGYWRIAGRREGVEVAVYEESRSSGKSSTTYTIVRAYFPSPLPSPCRLAKEGLFTRLGKGLFGLEDHEIGDSAFDAAVRIKARDPLPLMSRLSRPGAKDSVLALLAAQQGAFVTEAFAHWERARGSLAREDIEAALGLTEAVARGLGAD